MYIYNIQHTYCNCVRVSQFKTLFCSQKATSQQKRCEKRKLEAASTIAPWVFFPNRNLLFWLIHRLQHRFPGLQHGYHLLVGDQPSWCHGGAMVKGSDFTGFPLMVLLVVVCHIFPSLLGRQIQVDVKLWPHVAVALGLLVTSWTWKTPNADIAYVYVR